MLEIFKIKKNFLKLEYLNNILLYLFISFLISFLFYNSSIPFFILLSFMPCYLNYIYKEKINYQKEAIKEEFKEFLRLISSFLQTGHSMESAIKEAYKELQKIYTNNEPILQHINKIIQKINMNFKVENLFSNLGQNLNIQEIIDFATVLKINKQFGGNLVNIVQNTSRNISEQLELKREMATIISAKKYEFNIMMCIPFFILSYIKFTFKNFLDVLYFNITGIIIMTILLSLMIFAYILGKKIINIEV